jgi:hypothetical protein
VNSKAGERARDDRVHDPADLAALVFIAAATYRRGYGLRAYRYRVARVLELAAIRTHRDGPARRHRRQPDLTAL